MNAIKTNYKTFKTAAQVKKFIHTLGAGYAAIYNNDYIETDADICLKYWMESDKELRKEKIPYVKYMAARTRGFESAFRYEEIKDRVQAMGDKVICSIRIQYTLIDSPEYIVTYKVAN
jgi:hypothetical protein